MILYGFLTLHSAQHTDWVIKRYYDIFSQSAPPLPLPAEVGTGTGINLGTPDVELSLSPITRQYEWIVKGGGIDLKDFEWIVHNVLLTILQKHRICC